MFMLLYCTLMLHTLLKGYTREIASEVINDMW